MKKHACRKLIWIVSLTGLAVSGRNASAQTSAARTLPETGTFTVGIERFFGFSSTSVSSTNTVANQTVETTSTSSGFTLLSSFLDSGIYAVPRLGFDYTAAAHFTVGAAAGIGSRGSSDTVSNGGTSSTSDGPSRFAFILAPRAGFAWAFNDRLGFWGRAGFSYYRESTNFHRGNGETVNTRSGLSLNLEPGLVISIAGPLAITATAILDLPLSGSVSSETTIGNTTSTTDRDNKVRHIGIMTGAVAVF